MFGMISLCDDVYIEYNYTREEMNQTADKNIFSVINKAVNYINKN